MIGGFTSDSVADEVQHAQSDSTLEVTAVKGLLSRYCFECHGEHDQQASVRLDELDLATENQPSAELLTRVWSVLSTGLMPPDGAEAPSPQERATLVSWFDRHLTERALSARRGGRWTRNRRLTTEEYNFTLQELFGVDAEFADLLTADPVSRAGYRNDSEQLGVSSLQIESYLDSARRAVRRYVDLGDPQPDPLRYHIELEDLFYYTADRYATRERAPDPIDASTFFAMRENNLTSTPEFGDPLGPQLPGAYSEDEQLRAAIPKLNQQYVAIPRRLPTGELIVRVRCAGTADGKGRFPRMRVEAGITLGDGCSMNKRVLGEVDVTASLDEPQTYVFRIRLEDVPTKGPLREKESFDRLSVFDMDQLFISNITCDPQAIFAKGRGGYRDPASGSKQTADAHRQLKESGVSLLHLDCIEIEMFPGVGDEDGKYRWHVSEVGEDSESVFANRVIAAFMTEAFRRPVERSEVSTKRQLLATLRDRGDTFEESLRETLAAVLVSPSFLFLESNPPSGVGKPHAGVTSHQLAARLSYLLWLSPPDAQLRKCADDGSLNRPSVLRGEAERLLDDPRSIRFLHSFCRQWLRLDKHAIISVDRDAYPNWDADLAATTLRETLAYYATVFRSDANALDLIDSDYAILNDRLAEHYEIDNVTTGDLHKVSLPDESIRGGLMTQASLLTMNSDGADSHPIRRGVWLLDRLLNRPPPPPPPNVPEIDSDDPDLRGLGLIERIRQHRNRESCRACHEKIDPWGVPFENLDATGRWRESVQTHREGEIQSQPVQASARLPGGKRIDGITQLKQYLREERSDEFAHALTHHMLTYAIGHPPDFADRAQVQAIQRRFVESEFRLKELVLAIIESQLFRQND